MAATETTGITFKINNAKLCGHFVYKQYQRNFENLKQGFRRTTSWNKNKSEIKTQPKDNNLDYMTDPTFRNINRLFVQTIIQRW